MTMITAHSGCEGTAPNSREFLLHALTTGADALEIDIRRSPDGILILSHDSVGQDTAFITLEEAFGIVRDSEMQINCDLKTYHLEEDVLKTAAAAGIAKERLIFTGSVTDCMHVMQSMRTGEELSGVRIFINAEELIPDFYDPFLAYRRAQEETLEETQGKALKAAPGMITCKAKAETAAEKMLAEARAAFRLLTERCLLAGMDVININYRVCTDDLFRLCRESGIGLSVWTVDQAEDMSRMMREGVMNLTTREPSGALKIRRQADQNA